MRDKQKWPREQALAVASNLVDLLEEYCERITIAGSIRRMKEEVGDVELLYIPKMAKRKDELDLFGEAEVEVDLAAERLDYLLAGGLIEQRLNVNGLPSWGSQNRLAVHVASGIPVDFFAATTANWYNYLVCRTGPAESNQAIATRANQRGYRWRPYSMGFSGWGRWHAVHSEEDVFQFVGLPYREPWER